MWNKPYWASGSGTGLKSSILQMKRPELSDLMTSLKSLSPLPDLDLDLLRSAVRPRLSRTRAVMTGEVIIAE